MLVCALVALGGCGNSRTPVPSSVTPAAPSGFRTLTFAGQGIALRVPRNWSVAPVRGPLVSTAISGSAVVALWRFARSSPPRASPQALRRIERELLDAARARDPALRVFSATVATIGGAPAVELDALERIAGSARRVRSTHLYERHAELVLDEYAPPRLFHAVDHAVFSPVKRSLSPLPAAA
jgi:hypothetical protein